MYNLANSIEKKKTEHIKTNHECNVRLGLTTQAM